MNRRGRFSLGSFTGASEPVDLAQFDAALAFLETGANGSTVHLEAFYADNDVPGDQSYDWAHLGTESFTLAANAKQVLPVTVWKFGLASTNMPRFPSLYAPGRFRVVQTAGDAVTVNIEAMRMM